MGSLQMKKDLAQDPSLIRQTLRYWSRWPLAVQLLSFWLLVVLGAALWATGLWLLAGQPAFDRIPAIWQTSYLIGLYAWLLWLCRQARNSLSLPALPLWRPLRYGLSGAALSILSLSLLALLALRLGWVQWHTLRPDWPWIGLQVIVMAIAVASIEEIVFRGVMLDLALRSLSTWSALILQALIYAVLHLFRSDLAPLSWLTALISLGLTGLLLGQLRLRSKSLAMSVGLHGTWVALTSFASWAAWLVWDPAWAPWSGLGNPVYGLSGLLLLLGLNVRVAWPTE